MKPEIPFGRTRITMITAINSPIWPNSCPCHDVIAALTIPSTAAAGAVPRKISAPPTTTVTNASMMNVLPIVGTMVMLNYGGAAGSAGSALSASPTAPTDAKKEDSITAAKKSDYNKTFDDPIPDDEGGSGAASED